MKKGWKVFILFLLITISVGSMTISAQEVTKEAVEVDICIIGGDNHFVYKVPKTLHEGMSHADMQKDIESSLASHWKIKDVHYENHRSDVSYTFFVQDLFQQKQNGQMKIAIPYQVLVGMFGKDEVIQLRVLASKLSNWTINTKDWASLGFAEPLAFLSDRQYIYEGAVNELLQQRVGHFDGSISKKQLIGYSGLYGSFIVLQIIACVLLSKRFKNHILENAESIHHFRKLKYTYQSIPFFIMLLQIVFLVVSGLLTAFSLYFSPGIDLLFIIVPILINIILLPTFFSVTEQELVHGPQEDFF
ncbi:hypothetical protein [Lysinibacillus piscis]|uniref:DUF1430 domain-containing protein n=1 Tax=Lysinibacillus piscis TaxID=2518931 RepID=A0ABQ5NLP0_9BACI|nr:hypothetical protein [Lysinibacillus sp. KH24]GLC88954.1 hypothetical protein LYSBPC_20810 [Lysinibacillus sp. KH24]